MKTEEPNAAPPESGARKGCYAQQATLTAAQQHIARDASAAINKKSTAAFDCGGGSGTVARRAQRGEGVKGEGGATAPVGRGQQPSASSSCRRRGCCCPR